MKQYSVRRVVPVKDEYGGDYHQFIGYVPDNAVDLVDSMSGAEKARRIIETAYQRSSLKKVHEHDEHKIAVIECERDVPPDVFETKPLSVSDSNEEVDA